MAISAQDTARLRLGVAAYAVLRRGHPRLPELRLGDEGTGASAERLAQSFAAAGRLLEKGSEAERSIFAPPPRRLDAGVVEILHRTLQETEAALADDPRSDPLGPLFEASARADARRAQGQHFTPPGVVDLVLALAGDGAGRQLIDPTCGTGAFLLRAATGAGLWGCELDPRAAALARINLRRFGGPKRYGIRQGDVFGLLPGRPVEGRPLPPCHAVVGNLPYVRRHRRAESARLERRLGARWAARDPTLVKPGPDGAPVLRLSGHADLYALLLFHLADLLEPGGRLALLTANAYLDAGYGRALRSLLARHFRMVAILESRCEPWFADASVNTVITVVEKLAPDADPPAGLARFVKLTAPLAGDDPQRLAAAIEAVDAEAPVIVERPGCRVRLVDQRDLADDARDEPWSPYLRAPDLYFRLREHPALWPLGEQLTLRRGVTTNWNPFFYPPPDAGIEPEYLAPVVRSPRVSRTVRVDPDGLGDRLFVCDRSEAALRRAGHRGALAWIARGRRMTNRQGRPIRESLGGGRWWALTPHRYRILFTKAVHDTHLHRLVDRAVALDQRLYGVLPPREEDTALVAALLNSSLVALQAEVLGSTSLGDGALDQPVTRVRDRVLLPDLAALGPRPRERITRAFRRLAHRGVGPVWREVERQDRRALDDAVLDALGLDPARYRPALYRGLCELTRERLALAKARRALGKPVR